MYKKLRQQKGFTLIEVLLVVAIISILAGVVILAVNPTKQLGDARNATRAENVTTILDAVYQYEIDNNGNLPGTTANPITTATSPICIQNVATCPNGDVDLSDLTTNGTYLVAIPTDPQNTSTTVTGYDIAKDNNGRITVSAPMAEQNATISVTR